MNVDFNADPDLDPVFHSNADPAFQTNADPQTKPGVYDLQWSQFGSRLGSGSCNLPHCGPGYGSGRVNADPDLDPAFHSNADPTFQNNADPYQQIWCL